MSDGFPVEARASQQQHQQPVHHQLPAHHHHHHHHHHHQRQQQQQQHHHQRQRQQAYTESSTQYLDGNASSLKHSSQHRRYLWDPSSRQYWWRSRSQELLQGSAQKLRKEVQLDSLKSSFQLISPANSSSSSLNSSSGTSLCTADQHCTRNPPSCKLPNFSKQGSHNQPFKQCSSNRCRPSTAIADQPRQHYSDTLPRALGFARQPDYGKCSLMRTSQSPSSYRSDAFLADRRPLLGSHRATIKLVSRSPAMSVVAGWPASSHTLPSSVAYSSHHDSRCLGMDCNTSELSEECSCLGSLECLDDASHNSPLANIPQQRNQRLYLSPQHHLAQLASNECTDLLPRGGCQLSTQAAVSGFVCAPISNAFPASSSSHLPLQSNQPLQASKQQQLASVNRTTGSPPPPPPPPPQLIRQSTYTATSDTITDSIMLNEHSDRYIPTSTINHNHVSNAETQQVANASINDSNNNNGSSASKASSSKRQTTVSFRRNASTAAENADNNNNSNNNFNKSGNNKAASLQRIRSASSQAEDSCTHEQLGQPANFATAMRSNPAQQQQQQQHRQQRAAIHTCPSSQSRSRQQQATGKLTNAAGTNPEGFSNAPTGAICSTTPINLTQHQLQHLQQPPAQQQPQHQLPSSAAQNTLRPPSRHLLSSATFDGPLTPLPPLTSHRTNSPWMRITSIILTPIGIVIILFIVVSPLLHYLMAR